MELRNSVKYYITNTDQIMNGNTHKGALCLLSSTVKNFLVFLQHYVAD